MTQFHTTLIILFLSLFLSGWSNTKTEDSNNSPTLKEIFKDSFHFGTALNLSHIDGTDKPGLKIVRNHFSSIVAENCMKSMYLQPSEGVFFFDEADKFVEFGEQNNMHIVGHTLIWHSQAPSWFFTDKDGNEISAEQLKERMRNHIQTIVSRYKGRIHGWDVVNEAIEDNGEFRKSKFYQILGEDFIPLAFQYAHEADPDAELYYNDYNEWHQGKRETIVRLVGTLKKRGIRIDGVGMQGHVGMSYPTLEEYQAAIVAYTDAGVKVMITEFDMSALPTFQRNVGANISDTEDYQDKMNPYRETLPDSVMTEWKNRMIDFFNLFIHNSDKISRVTMWGVTDGDSWKNNYPIRGRTDYPLLFDRAYNAKPVVQEIINMTYEAK